jgi:hypothetical protein
MFHLKIEIVSNQRSHYCNLIRMNVFLSPKQWARSKTVFPLLGTFIDSISGIFSLRKFTVHMKQCYCWQLLSSIYLYILPNYSDLDQPFEA